MTDFTLFSRAVHAQFEQMSQKELYRVDLGGADIFDVYLQAFPEGTNPIYRERTFHDCSCCKNFIRNIGDVVGVSPEGNLETVWDIALEEDTYKTVANTLKEFISNLPIKSLFRTKERGYGAESTIELLEGNHTHKWHHFWAGIAPQHYTDNVGGVCGKSMTNSQVFKRGLEEITLESLETIQNLIEDNLLYRGEEHLKYVKLFKGFKQDYTSRDVRGKDLFVWAYHSEAGALFRNTVIGTLAQDLSENMDLDKAVKRFEAKVAPENYKRPKALITPRMVEDAMNTITELNLKSALERRYAHIEDVSVNNVLFVDNKVRGQMKDGLKDLLMEETVTPPVTTKKAQEISIDKFMEEVIPQSKSLDLLLKNTHLGNFMSLTAPIHTDVEPIFQWPNNFAWSYDGNVTDSIKERVKRAGGNVNAKLRVSLAWYNTDDLDLHLHTPSGKHIYYGHKGDILDVDMNAGKLVRDPVENLQWTKNLENGIHRINVKQFNKRESIDRGFTLEVEYAGVIKTFVYEKGVSGTVEALKLTVENDKLISVEKVDKTLKASDASQVKWGVATEQRIPIDSVLFSPNHWDEHSIGNKHWFFILKNCKNPDKIRGIYNEFLKPELNKHRKVFEVLGDKTKCEVTDNQLSGVGFSSTQKNTITVFADNRPYLVKF